MPKKNMIVKLTKAVEPSAPYNVRQHHTWEFVQPVVGDGPEPDNASTDHMLELLRTQLRDADDYHSVYRMMYGMMAAGGTKAFAVKEDTTITVSVCFQKVSL